MKILQLLKITRLISVCAFCVLGSAEAVTKTWVGTTNVWATGSNWSPSGVPGSGDDVVFANNKPCTIAINTTVNSINLTTYSNTFTIGTTRTITIKQLLSIQNGIISKLGGGNGILMIPNSQTVITGGFLSFSNTATPLFDLFTLSGGVFTPGITNTFVNDFNMTNGTINGTNSGTFNIVKNFTKTNGISNTTNINVEVLPVNTSVISISGVFTFNSLNFSTELIGDISIDIIGNLSLMGGVTYNPNDLIITINRDPIFIAGNFDVTSGSMLSTGTVISNNLFIFNGTTPQTVNIESDVVGGYIFQLGGMVFNNTSGGVSLAQNVTSTNLIGGISVTGGSFDDGGFDITLANDQNFVMSANTTLSLSGASLPVVSGAGAVLIHPTANLHAYGTNNLTLSNPYSFTNFTINKPTSGEVNLTAATSVLGMLNIQALAGANKLNTNGNLTLVSTATQTASLIDFSTAGSGGSVNGNVKVQRFYQGVGRPKLFGTPIVSGATVFTIGEGTYKALLYTETGQEPGIPRKTDPTRSDFGNSFINAHSINGGNLSVGRGYSLRQNSNGLAVFDGVVNNGTINFAVTNTTTPGFATTTPGFNLMSNPYPSAIDWTLVNVNSTGVSNTAVSIFNGSTYTATNIIASGQGFFVKAISNGNITFSNTARVNSNTANNTFLRTEEKSRLLYLYVKNNSGGFNDALTFSFDNNASNNFDSNFDITKINAVAPLSPFLFSQSDGLRLSLDVRPFPTKDITIPITLRVNTTSDYTFSTSNIDEWYADYSVFLKDSLNGNVTFTNLKTTLNYVFSKAITDTDEATRFSIVLKYTPGANSATIPGSNNNGNGGFTGGTPTNDISLTEGTPDEEVRQEVTTHINSMFAESNLEKSIIYSFENKVAIKFASNISNSSIEIIDLMGNKIFSELDLNSVGKKVIEIPVSNASIYFIKLTNNKENIIQKVFLY